MNHEKIIEMIKETKNEETLIKLLQDWNIAWNGNCPILRCHAYDDIHGNRKYRIDNLVEEGVRRYYTFQGFKNALIKFINSYLEGRCAGKSPEYYQEESEWIYLIFINTLEKEFKPTMAMTLKAYNILVLIKNEDDGTYHTNAQTIMRSLNTNIKNFYEQYNRFTGFTKQGAFNDMISVIKMAAEIMEVNLPAVEIDLSNIENSYDAIWQGIYAQIPITREEIQNTFKLAQSFKDQVDEEIRQCEPTIDMETYDILDDFIKDYIHTEL